MVVEEWVDGESMYLHVTAKSKCSKGGFRN